MDIKYRLAERLQAGLPLTERPYRAIGEELSCDEDTILSLVRELTGEGIIRSFGAFADFERLGYRGLLFGIAVPGARVGAMESLMNARREVTHVYLRQHKVNLWCTALLKGGAAEPFTEEVLHACGHPFVLLATERRLKLRPTFRFSGDEDAAAREEARIAGAGYAPGEDLPALFASQADFPAVPRPFGAIAARAGTTEASVLESLKRLKDAGVLRRIGASLDHRRVGYGANALVAWDVADAAEAGGRAARFPWVSHCYLRGTVLNTLPFEWPYPLYTMLHARSPEALEARILEMEEVLAPRAAAVMPTERELKKTRYLLH